jgi:hypothetical protein
MYPSRYGVIAIRPAGGKPPAGPGVDIFSGTLNYSPSIFSKDKLFPSDKANALGQHVMYLHLYISTLRQMDRCTDIHDRLP